MAYRIPSELRETLRRRGDGGIVFLTGAGVSAASGIPTFRGKEGYWTVGAVEYHPQEMATQAAFRRMPREVWRWYLYRLGVCRAAEPNAAHFALARLEEALGDRFTLITQNVDGLHLRAGNSEARTHQVHGNIEFMRCPDGTQLVPVPAGLAPRPRDAELTDEEWSRLVVPGCAEPARPHVLWFDEYYDETLYRSESGLKQVIRSSLLVVVGSSGAAALPHHAAGLAARVGAAVIDVNPEAGPFSEIAESLPDGHWARGPADEVVPALVDVLLEVRVC